MRTGEELSLHENQYLFHFETFNSGNGGFYEHSMNTVGC